MPAVSVVAFKRTLFIDNKSFRFAVRRSRNINTDCVLVFEFVKIAGGFGVSCNVPWSEKAVGRIFPF